MLYYLNFVLFLVFSAVFFFTPIETANSNQVFLTVSTFLFSIFAGFFISRQGNRYSIIRGQIASLDGEFSNIYRNFQHFGKTIQEKAKTIIKHDYDVIVKKHDWKYTFAQKTKVVTSLHQLIEDSTNGKEINEVQKQAIERIMTSLGKLQIVRKMMIILTRESIPKFQWLLLVLLAAILLITIIFIPSHYNVIAAVLKGAFAGAIIFVFVLLKQLNKLELFEKTVGEESAQDVLDIFSGKR
jgi:hypothetical protein